jgi:DNA-binding beta-propeller fold protein YncE
MIQHSKKKLYFIFFLSAALFVLRPYSGQAFNITRVRHLFDLEHGFLQPSDVAVGKDHRIYVLDGVNHCVKVFDGKGAFILSFGSKGRGEGHFNSPLGITTDIQGRVYVADSGNRRVQVFTPRGKLLELFKVNSKEGEKPSDPVDLAVDKKRQRLYVVDNDNHHVLLYSLNDFKPIERWGTEGEGMQEFRNPFLISIAQDTSVLVVDVLNTRVQVWSPQGEAVASIDDYGADPGQLYRPKGVCVDKDNKIFVSDSYIGVIQVFNRYGFFMSVVGDEEGNVLKMKTPVGITIDDRQRLYVVEMFINRISVYQILNDTIEGVIE